jgi:hypothetical protein
MYDDLWQTTNGAASWIDSASDEQREWLEGLADTIIEKGSEPVWAQAAQAFRTRFEVDKPVDSTIMGTVRRLVRQRG